MQLGLIPFYHDRADVFQFAGHGFRPFNDYVNCFILQQFDLHDFTLWTVKMPPQELFPKLYDCAVKINYVYFFKHKKSLYALFNNDWLL